MINNNDEFRLDFYGQRRVLENWSGSRYINEIHEIAPGHDARCFSVMPGVSKESFFEQSDASWPHCNGYVWGNSSIKKGRDSWKPRDDWNPKSVFGVCPFVYEHAISRKYSPKREYDIIFLPRSDVCVRLSENYEYQNELDSIGSDNKIYISLYRDKPMWKSKLFKGRKIYHIRKNDYDEHWTEILYKFLRSANTIYNPIFSSSVVYGTFLNKSTKFYKISDDIYKFNDIRKNIPSLANEPKFFRSWIPRNKSEKWREFMNYIEDVFIEDGLTEDKKFFTYEMLSLDKIKSPKDVASDLMYLDSNMVDMNDGADNTTYEYIVEYSKQFEGSKPTQRTIDFWKDL